MVPLLALFPQPHDLGADAELVLLALRLLLCVDLLGNLVERGQRFLFREVDPDNRGALSPQLFECEPPVVSVQNVVVVRYDKRLHVGLMVFEVSFDRFQLFRDNVLLRRFQLRELGVGMLERHAVPHKSVHHTVEVGPRDLRHILPLPVAVQCGACTEQVVVLVRRFDPAALLLDRRLVDGIGEFVFRLRLLLLRFPAPVSERPHQPSLRILFVAPEPHGSLVQALLTRRHVLPRAGRHFHDGVPGE